MARELNNASIHKLLESAGRSIPDLDGHNIRIAERRILWSKLAQQNLADVGIPTQTPEQIAQWSKVQPGDELAPPPPTNQTEQQLAQLQRQLATPVAGARPTAPTGVAHVQRPAPRPAKKENVIQLPGMSIEGDPPNVIQLPEMNIEGNPNEMAYTPGPGDPNYTGASVSTKSLIRVAKYLEKKK